MDNQEIFSAHRIEREKCAEIAGLALSEMSLPKEVDVPQHIKNLGCKIATCYRKNRDQLELELGSALPKYVGLALHEYWLACCDGAVYFQTNIDGESFNDNSYTRNLATAQGYADEQGWANTLANGCADVVPLTARSKWIRDLTGLEIVDVSIMYRCIALYWFYQASIEADQGNYGSMIDLIFEAQDALALDFSNSTWDDAWKDATENAEESAGSRARSELAKKAARAAHTETHALKAEAWEFWKENIPPTVKNEPAARILARQFPISLRTLSGYVSEWKKVQSTS